MNDQQYFLANAYVDGELTADERRFAESDPEVMSEVEQVRALQDQVRSVRPPSAAARETAIAAAIAQFAPTALTARPSTSTRVTEFRRRGWSTRYLGIAAGLVAVGLLGTVVVSSLRSGGEDDAASKFGVDDSTAISLEEPSSSRILESAGGAVESGADEFTDEPAAELAPAAAESAPEPAADEAASDAAAPIAAPGRPTIDPSQPLSTPAELGSYGSYLVELQQAGQLPPTPNTKCSQPGVMGSTRYLFDTVPIEVLIAVDDIARTTTAIDPDTCEELVVGPLF